MWNTERDGEKEKVGDRPAKLNEKKSDRQLEREIKYKGDISIVGRTTWKFRCRGWENKKC